MTTPSPRLSPKVQNLFAREIAAAGGREVCFVATLDEASVVIEARPVARGTADEVLALPGVADRGEMVLHNHPSGGSSPRPPTSRSRPGCTTGASASAS
jgi:ATP-dependent DNA helicase DinG